VSKTPGSIKLLFYTPKSYKASPSIESHSITGSKPWKGYPILIDFHGGGFSTGKASDYDRWATTVAEHAFPSKDTVVISVSYRLAPECPFPHSNRRLSLRDPLNLGPRHLPRPWYHTHSLSGFSAGGNLSLTVPIHLHTLLVAQAAQTATVKTRRGIIVSIAAFYPNTNRTQTHAERNVLNPHLIAMAPDSVFDFFDASYMYPPPTGRSGPLFSVDLAGDTLLQEVLPDFIAMITYGSDQLLAEGEAFRKRQKVLGKMVEGVGHT
jgi:putative ergosteryl-3beta-O-L-aspartate hydrolase